ncbi:hypothetical protein DIPPA_14790 [Diplonema papillatum]|nr:hypothetical protein DIPPA_32272 [Diplonema papillatum]KAJ9442999.1 hypothetical protein DIPPA_14790 [Diplonema papillatum]|eukprot:gene4398-6813_t
MRAFIVVCFAAAAQASFFSGILGGHSYEDAPSVKICHKDADLFKVNADALKVVPYPPKKNEEITVSLSGTLTKELHKVRMSINVHYGVIPLGDHDVSLCSELHCPIPAGPFHMERTIKLPSSAPAGSYSFSVKGKNENGEEVICASIKMNID